MRRHISPCAYQFGAVTPAQVGLMAALVVIVTAGTLVLTGSWPLNKTPEPVPEPQPAAQAEIATTVPVEPLAEPMPEPEPPVAPILTPDPLPKLDESDNAVRDAVADIPLGTAGQQYLLPGNIIERSTSVIYLMAEGEVPYKLLPIARPKAAFHRR